MNVVTTLSAAKAQELRHTATGKPRRLAQVIINSDYVMSILASSKSPINNHTLLIYKKGWRLRRFRKEAGIHVYGSSIRMFNYIIDSHVVLVIGYRS